MTDYIEPRLSTDPQEVAKLAFDYIQAHIPGWIPNDADLETIVIEAIAQMTSEARDVASAVPTAIFRYFGGLVGVVPLDATYAQGDVTFTASDEAGYAIDAGTVVAYAASGDSLIAFLTTSGLTIAPGDTTGTCHIQAAEIGSGSSDLGTIGTPLVPITPLTNIISCTLLAATYGGIDGEEDQDYLDRLAGWLRLLTPTPILPPDFSALARNIIGVWRAITLDGYNPNANELQTITVTGSTSGTFTLTFTGQTTAGIAWNATAATIKTALEALSNIAPGDVIVTGGPASTAPLTVEFAGAYDHTNVAAMTANAGSLVGSGHAVAIATLRDGSARTGNERMVATAVIDQDGEESDPTTKNTVQAYLESLRESTFIVNMMSPIYNEIDVAYTVVKDPLFDSADVQARTDAAITDFLSPANYGHDANTNVAKDRSWVRVGANKVYPHDIAPVIKGIAGVVHLDSLQICLHGGSLSDADITLLGDVSLPRAGTITGTVV